MVSVAQLAQELDTTPVTIRSDLDKLEADGWLVRVQGGAVLKPHTEEIAYVNSALSNREEKASIAAAIADLVRDGDTLFMNSGTTVLQVAEALQGHKRLNVVTNALDVAELMGRMPTFRVILLGGEVNAQYGFISGNDAQEQLRHYQADWAILSLDGISAAGGLTTYHAEEAIINRMMLSQAKRILAAANYTKVGKAGVLRFCEAGEGICLVTDSKASYEAAEALETCGVSIVFANGLC